MWTEERGPPPLGPCLVPVLPRPVGSSMGQQSFSTMNSATSGKLSTRTTGYHQKALAEIRNSLLPFANIGGDSNVGSSAASTISTLSTTSGVSSASGLSGFSTASGTGLDKDNQLHNMGYSELKQGALDAVNGVGHGSGHGKGLNGLKLMRKPSLEREADSGAGSSRSDSPRLMDLGMGVPGMGPSLGPNLGPRQYSPPPPPPPRSGSTPPPPPPPHHAPYPSNVQQLLKRMSPAPVVPTRSPAAPPPQGVPALPALPALPPPPQRGTSPSGGQGLGQGRQPMILQNGPQVQQQLSQQMQALYQTEPPPPYPLVPPSPGPGSTMAPAPPSYSASIQSRQSPTQDYRKSPSSGIYSGPTSAGSPSPVTVTPCGMNGAVTPPSVARPTPMLAWGARQAKTQPPIIMQSVKSTQVQKPILQTATAPAQPQTATVPTPASTPQQSSSGPQPPPPSYASSIQHKQHSTKPPAPPPVPSPSGAPSPAPAPAPSPAPAPGPAPAASASPVTVPTTEPPSYASTMQVLAVQRGVAVRPPALPPGGGPGPHDGVPMHGMQTVQSRASPACAVMQRKYSAVAPGAGACQDGDTTDGPRMTNGDHASAPCPPLPPTASSSVANKCHGMQNGDRRPVPNPSSSGCPPGCPPGPHHKVKHQSPIPERKHFSKEKEEERRDSRVRNYSPQAFKFYMEQHIENLFKSSQARLFRIRQLENEMKKADLSRDAQFHMRKMLSKRESNYIRMRRAKMDKSMFTKIKTIGVGAFGEVTLVKKVDSKHLYAMKTLRKADVLKRNQVAHVKAERDILAEADNEWVVKLYYSFQDKDNLYFVMDYVAGGDLMSLLCKYGVFKESLARFYIAELTCAVESVHKMGFIHRDIKPDNILIDSNGHLKLTDFGLCTGFRWTHNSKYYQINGDHARQDSMDIPDDWSLGKECRCNPMKPLERRRRREHQRCLAHSLVGTPNYIAPEVLQRTGYTQLCDWWSVGVILYEMLVGSPPFLANTPGETQYKVIHWETTLHIPKAANLSPEATDLILKLCTSADRRLGKNANEVKEHPFFASINFDGSLRKQKAPHQPRIQHSMDTSNFDPVAPERLRNSDSSDDSDEQLESDNHPFHGFFEFTFRRFFDEGGWPQKLALDDNDNQSPVYV